MVMSFDRYEARKVGDKLGKIGDVIDPFEWARAMKRSGTPAGAVGGETELVNQWGYATLSEREAREWPVRGMSARKVGGSEWQSRVLRLKVILV